MRTKWLLVLVAASVSALHCLADWGQAESADFVLDTTVPEPALAALAVAACVLWRLRRPAA
jgi:hypothetical protein